MNLPTFKLKNEMFAFIYQKLTEYLGDPPSKELMQHLADEVVLPVEELSKFLTQKGQGDFSSSVIIPCFAFFYTPYETYIMLKEQYTNFAKMKELSGINPETIFLKNPKKLFQPIHSEIMAHVGLLQKVRLTDLYEKFGENLAKKAIESLVSSRKMVIDGEYLKDSKVQWDITSNAQLGMMRADLDALPIATVNNVYARYNAMGRLSHNVHHDKLQPAYDLIIKFYNEFRELVEVEDGLEKDAQLNFNFMMYTRTVESELQPIYRAEQQQIESLTKVTQMFAHDVRKPFSMMQVLLQMLDDATSIHQVKKLIQKYGAVVDQSMVSIDNMIKDLLLVGKEIHLELEPIDPASLIDCALADTFRFQNSDIQFEFQFGHQHQVIGDLSKLLRVFSNIFSNACQAMNHVGKIWIKTKEIEKNGNNVVQFCLGNNNSFIPALEIPRLFEAFYSKNKKDGTGLGLAIVHKIITSHGGEIWCQSIEEAGVEFYFTLPSVDIKALCLPSLPTHSSAITVDISNDKSEIVENDLSLQMSANVETDLLQFMSQLLHPVKVAVVDDENIYRQLPLSYVMTSNQIKNSLIIKEFEHGFQSIEVLIEFNPDLILLDFDLNDNVNGLELSDLLRKRGFKGFICIHSNRSAALIQNKLSSVGADLFIPKPISKIQFFKILLSLQLQMKPKSKQQKIVVIDDNIIVLAAWQNLVPDVICYQSPDEFFENITQSKISLSHISKVVTDFYFDDIDASVNGLEFAKTLREKGYMNPIYLASCSGAEFDHEKNKDFITKVIPKSPKQSYLHVMEDVCL